MCLHPAKFGGHMHCVSGGMMFLLFLLEEQESIFLHISAITIFFKAHGISYSHTRTFRSAKHFPPKAVPVSPMKLSRYWSHTFIDDIFQVITGIPGFFVYFLRFPLVFFFFFFC